MRTTIVVGGLRRAILPKLSPGSVTRDFLSDVFGRALTLPRPIAGAFSSAREQLAEDAHAQWGIDFLSSNGARVLEDAQIFQEASLSLRGGRSNARAVNG